MKSMEKHIVFQMEPADRSVGIMSEGFSAWEKDGDKWCNLDDIHPEKFTWFDNETGNEVAPPQDHSIVESALIGFADGFYAQDKGE